MTSPWAASYLKVLAAGVKRGRERRKRKERGKREVREKGYRKRERE